MFYLKDYNAVFLHCIKCGGTWARRAILSAGINAHGIGHEHDGYQDGSRLYPNAKLFTIIRNPLTWYQSFWADRMLLGWGGNLEIGHTCQSDDFGTFVQRACQMHPGFVGELYREFCGPGVRIIKLEKLPSALELFLFSIGPEVKLSLSPENRGASLPGIRERCVYTPELTGLVWRSEAEALSKYGYQ